MVNYVNMRQGEEKFYLEIIDINLILGLNERIINLKF